mmetsp:Transcript_7114/g.20950  ORF Transcript_7114/g.20950 Transcript_7114/m.20950 type:complete len:205 (+) Transcript_7114:560-1174(+)
MRQHGHDLLRGHLLDERVEEHDALRLEEAEHVGVRVARALRAVHGEELVERVVHRLGERLDGLAQGPRLEGLVLVEEGLDEHGVDGDEEEGHDEEEAAHVQRQVLGPRGHDYFEEQGHAGRAQHGLERERLGHVREEEAHARLVEAVLLLDDEGGIQGHGQAEHRVQGLPEREEDQRDADLVVAGKVAVPDGVRQVPEVRQAAQ